MWKWTRLTRFGRLDTGRRLTEARQLYARNGYREVPPFNEGRLADQWFEKPLS